MSDRRNALTRASRNALIDRMAEAMAHQKGRNWSRMTIARRDQLRAQVRAGLRASLSDGSEAFGWITISVAERAEADGTTVSAHHDAWVREVLA